MVVSYIALKSRYLEVVEGVENFSFRASQTLEASSLSW